MWVVTGSQTCIICVIDKAILASGKHGKVINVSNKYIQYIELVALSSTNLSNKTRHCVLAPMVSRLASLMCCFVTMETQVISTKRISLDFYQGPYKNALWGKEMLLQFVEVQPQNEVTYFAYTFNYAPINNLQPMGLNAQLKLVSCFMC